MKFAEDHRHDTMIAMAGYATPMNRLFGANPGLRSRFPFQLEFSSCEPQDSVEIAQLFARRFHIVIEPAALSSFSDDSRMAVHHPEHSRQANPTS